MNKRILKQKLSVGESNSILFHQGAEHHFQGGCCFSRKQAEEEDSVINMDDNVETGELRRVLKPKFRAFPRYFYAFSRRRVRLVLLL